MRKYFHIELTESDFCFKCEMNLFQYHLSQSLTTYYEINTSRHMLGPKVKLSIWELLYERWCFHSVIGNVVGHKSIAPGFKRRSVYFTSPHYLWNSFHTLCINVAVKQQHSFIFTSLENHTQLTKKWLNGVEYSFTITSYSLHT